MLGEGWVEGRRFDTRVKKRDGMETARERREGAPARATFSFLAGCGRSAKNETKNVSGRAGTPAVICSATISTWYYISRYKTRPARRDPSSLMNKQQRPLGCVAPTLLGYPTYQAGGGSPQNAIFFHRCSRGRRQRICCLLFPPCRTPPLPMVLPRLRASTPYVAKQ